MENAELERTVIHVLSTELNIPSSAKLLASTALRDDLGLDSMSTLTFLMALEDSIEGFLIDANTLEATDVETIGSVVRYIERQLNA